jgi:acyl-CoA thioester hydrolase
MVGIPIKLVEDDKKIDPFHVLQARVYYEDTDAGGVMFYANHLKFCERGRTEFLRARGFENSQIFRDFGIIFVVRKLEAEYLAPARLDDLLTIRTSLSSRSKTSLTFAQKILNNDQTLFEMLCVIVAVGKNGKPQRLPEEISL